jgi:hypothetical protein
MPGGSSTGSAVGVSAGYSPLALGTETDGSTIQPANRASLFAIKPTHGIISLDGVWQLSTSFDVIGCMEKSSTDLANLFNVLVESNSSDYPRYLTKSFGNLKLGFLDPDIWRFPHPVEGVREQMVSIGILTPSFLAANAVPRESHILRRCPRSREWPPRSNIHFQYLFLMSLTSWANPASSPLSVRSNTHLHYESNH